MKIYYTNFESPVGEIMIASDGDALLQISLKNQKHSREPGDGWEQKTEIAPIAQAQQQLQEYFAGKRRTFDLPLRFGGTPFQRRVWAELARIPYGETISYGELARRIANPRAVRAVGLANGRNPIAIVIPCHRVIGANGTLTGYGGGLPRKRQLLDLEAQFCRTI